jgi:hypothetical protein
MSTQITITFDREINGETAAILTGILTEKGIQFLDRADKPERTSAATVVVPPEQTYKVVNGLTLAPANGVLRRNRQN